MSISTTTALSVEDVFDALNLGLIIIDNNLKILLWNDWMVKHSNISHSVTIDKQLTDVFLGTVSPAFFSAVKNTINYRLPVVLSTAFHRAPLPLYDKPDLNRLPMRMHQSITITPIKHGLHQICCLIQVTDASYAVKREKILYAYSENFKQQAITDAMTGICNRRFFDEHYRLVVAEAKRQKHSVSVLMIDIDFFKAYNDHYGHIQGDQVIRLVASTLKSQLTRASDIVARYGGEEFVLILPHLSREQADIFAEKLRLAVLDLVIPHAKSQAFNCLSISIGLSTGIPGNESDMLVGADEALYQAKANGRNQCFSVDSTSNSKAQSAA